MEKFIQIFFLVLLAPHNASQPSPAGFDVGLGSNSIGASSATPGQGILPTLNQGGAVGGVQAPPNAVGGMPRPLLPPQQQQQNSMVPMNNAQLAGNNPPSAVAAAGQPVPPGAMNRGPPHNAALQSQQQTAGSTTARNIRGSISDNASNIEHIV